MLAIAFWNINKCQGDSISDAIAGLAQQICADSALSGSNQEVLLCLGEPGGADVPAILQDLQRSTPQKRWWVKQPSGTKRFVLFGTVAEDTVDITQAEIARALPCSLTRVANGATPCLYDIWFVHLSSPMYAWHPQIKSHDEAQFLRQNIEDRELKLKPKGTVAIGDFNMEPFSESMVGTSSLNATPCRHVAKSNYKLLRPGENIPYFFNPMWEHLGSWSSNRQPGTFHRKENSIATQWHIIDHVLIRPSLIESLANQTPRILSQAGNFSLVSIQGEIGKISDHLPVLVTLKI